MYISDLNISCFLPMSEEINDFRQNLKVAVITLLSGLANIPDVFHPFMTTYNRKIGQPFSTTAI